MAKRTVAQKSRKLLKSVMLITGFRLIIALALCNTCFFLKPDAAAEERNKQLTEEEKEIVEMLDFLEEYEMLRTMDIIEGMETKNEDDNGKDGRIEGGEK